MNPVKGIGAPDGWTRAVRVRVAFGVEGVMGWVQRGKVMAVRGVKGLVEWVTSMWIWVDSIF